MKQDLKGKYGSWAFIGGAAEGLGSAYARALASGGMNLILVDQQKALQEKLSGQLRSSYGIQVIPMHLDLAESVAVQKIEEVLKEYACRLFIYNAAFSRVQKFMENDPAQLDRYVQVNVRTPLHLVHAFCALHNKQSELRKGIILMSSLAGSWGTRLLGPYGGTKAFNHNLAESLYHELKDDGFDVLACIAGPSSTPGYLASLPRGKANTVSVMTPDQVVSAALGALGTRAFVIPGFRNKLNYFLMSRILPRRYSLTLMNHAVGELYREKL